MRTIQSLEETCLWVGAFVDWYKNEQDRQRHPRH